MESKETILKGLKWWIDHKNGEALPLAYSSVVDIHTLIVSMQEQIDNLQKQIKESVNQ